MTSPFVSAEPGAPRLYHIVSSPIGRLLLLGDGHALTGLWMIDAERHTSRGVDGLTSSPEAFREVEAQLGAYFAGDLKEFTVPLAPSGSPFQLSVWTELTKIPYGSTVTYGGAGQRLQPDLGHRAVPPGHRQRRQPDRLRRRPGAQGGAAPAGRRRSRHLVVRRIYPQYGQSRGHPLRNF
jgi:methylated-DNA-[protein]-cysteine S-methyltransferase